MSEQQSNSSSAESAESQQHEALAIIQGLYEAFAKTKTSDDMIEFWHEVPEGNQDNFISIINGIIQQAQQRGDQDTVNHLSERLEVFKTVHEMQLIERQMSPMVRALVAFFQASGETTARQVFEEQRSLLQPYEALQMLETLFQSDDAVAQQRVTERTQLLQELRHANDPAIAPTVLTPLEPTLALENERTTQSIVFNNPNLLATNVYQAQEQNIKIDQATFQQAPLELRWLPPVAPQVDVHKYVLRPEPMEQVEAKLAAHCRAAIASIAVHGTGGVGKTILAQLLIEKRKDIYAGVIWEVIGQEPSNSLVQTILNRWASYTFGGQVQTGRQYTPSEVRSLLNGHGHLLVVLDDIWGAEDVQPLLDALPSDCEVLLTTRRRQTALDLDLDVYELDVLTQREARELVSLRLRERPLTSDDNPWIADLIDSVGRHVLALDIALRSVRRRRSNEWAATAARVAADLRTSQGFGELPLDERDRSYPVERSLQRSYLDLSPVAQQRFRNLGVFAPNAPFTTEMAAAVWSCSSEQASDTLNLFDDAALLTAAEPGIWRQHTLLWLYALALLRASGEEDEVAARHADAYLVAMRIAYDTQQYHIRLIDYPQLKHAFRWAIEQSLDVAVGLVINCANLQGAFVEYTRDNLDWCREALAAAKQRGAAVAVARAWGALGNALSQVAKLFGEDRQARLYEALGAYDEALRFFTPEMTPLDYAMIQNNRVNVLSELATLPSEDKSIRLRQALVACNEALRFRLPDTTPSAYAMTQHNRGYVLSEMAVLPGENKRAHLREALAACAEALRFYTPDTAPLDYAMVQNNRGNRLFELAMLDGEDKSKLLVEALNAYEEALRFRRPDTAPLAYASTQNNKGNLLADLAMLPGENRRTRLRESLRAYDEALLFYTPNAVPLSYAGTQNNRASVLIDLAMLPGEDQRTCLKETVLAYREALRFYTLDTAPQIFADTQCNIGNRLSELGMLVGEDRQERFIEALAAYQEALRFYTPNTNSMAYAGLQINCARIFRKLDVLSEGSEGKWLKQELAAYDEALRFYTFDAKPEAYTEVQINRGNVLSELAELPEEDTQERLGAALKAYDEALRFYTLKVTPQGYANIQNNRAGVLSDLAMLPEENRCVRLKEALLAYEKVLLFYTPITALPVYINTQNSRTRIMSTLARCSGENKQARLRDTLAVSDDILRLLRPDTLPLDYAMAENNRANILYDLAALPGEDHQGRLAEALDVAWRAFVLLGQLQRLSYQQIACDTLRRVRDACGDGFDTLWQQLHIGDCPAWLRNLGPEGVTPDE